MAHDDLRSFLQTLAKEGQLLHITEEVAPEPDLAAAACAATRIGDTSPALYFDNVTGFTNARIAMNVHGSWPNHALALGLPATTPVKEQVEEFARRWGDFPVAPERRDNPPFAENTLDEIGLCWPREITPADVHVVAAGKDQAVFDAAEALVAGLVDAGVDVLYDDRAGKVSPASSASGVGKRGGRAVKGTRPVSGSDPRDASSSTALTRQLLPWQGPVPRPV